MIKTGRVLILVRMAEKCLCNSSELQASSSQQVAQELNGKRPSGQFYSGLRVYLLSSNDTKN